MCIRSLYRQLLDTPKVDPSQIEPTFAQTKELLRTQAPKSHQERRVAAALVTLLCDLMKSQEEDYISSRLERERHTSQLVLT